MLERLPLNRYDRTMNETLLTEQRRDEILIALKEQKRLRVPELAKRFGVSGTTIRTDLTVLEQRGLLRRTHGGAVPVLDMRDILPEQNPSERVYQEEKRRIACRALSYIHDGDTILLDTGTTVTALAEEIARSSLSALTIYSNDRTVMTRLETKTDAMLHLLGGTLRAGFHYTYGPELIHELGSYHFSTVFLAANAISRQGVSTTNSDLSALKRAMIESADQVILLMDSSKIGKQSFQKCADLSDIDILITDSGISGEERSILEDSIHTVIIV